MDLTHKIKLLEVCAGNLDGQLARHHELALRAWWEIECADASAIVEPLLKRADEWEAFIIDHPAHRHHFYDQLADAFSIEQYAAFLLENGSFPAFLPLVTRTLSVQNCDQARAAIAHNIADEQIPVPHADLMRRLFVGVRARAGDRVQLETFASLIDRTLIFYYGFYCEPWHLVGSLWATEVMANHRLVHMHRGLLRLGLNAHELEFFHVHLACDDGHAAEWQTEVVLPSIARDASLCRPLVEGFVACLQTSQRYLDYLSQRASRKVAA